MSIRFTPGAKPSKPRVPHGSSHKTLTVKVKPHTRNAPKPRAPKPNPLNAPITPGSGITVAQARRMASNATRVRYGGQEQGIGQQIAQTQQLGKDQQGWYQQYLAQLAKYQQDAENTARATNTAMQQQADSLRTLDQGNLTAQNQANTADAAARGATPSAQVSQDASNASLVRQALEGSLGALLAARGGAAATQASNLAHVVAPIQQGQALASNAKQQAALREQLTGLKGTEGAYAQSFIDSLTGSEAKNILAASIASGKDLTQQTRIRETTRHNKAQEKIAANNPAKQKTKAELDYFNKHGYWPPTGPPKKPGVAGGRKVKPTAGPGSLTTSQENHIIQGVKGAKAAAMRLMSQPGAKSGEVRALLAAGKVDGIKYTPDEINAAFDLLPPKYGGLGGLSKANVKALHRMGVHVNGVFPLVFGGATKVTAKQLETTNNVFGL